MAGKKTNTGFKGIVYSKRSDRYVTNVSYQGKSKNKAVKHILYVGSYKTLEEARLARTEFVLALM